MPQYIVELQCDARELYSVEADSEAEAQKNWHHGDHILTEVTGSEVISVMLEDE